MLETIRLALSLVLIGVGVLGYSFRPPPNYIGCGKAVHSLFVFYLVLASFALSEICGVYEVPAIAALLFVLAYGLAFLRRVWVFEGKRFKDALAYGGVVYLMGEHVRISPTYLTFLNVVLLLSSICVAVMTAYAILRYGKVGFLIFENYELVSTSYAISLFLGICTLAGVGKSVPHAIAVLLTLYAFYVVASKYVG